MKTEVKIELKYCEGCGGLFLRHVGNPQAYCVNCEPEMLKVARSRKRRSGRKHWNRAVQADGGVACA
jgi:hypothetical protein